MSVDVIAMRGCSVTGCKRKHYARGWCRLHYRRWCEHGTPEDPRPTVAQRFWGKVDRRGPEDCWIWRANADGKGYGQFFPESRHPVGARRWAYEAAKGPIPAGMSVMHSCDTPLCCNPAHLSVGTHADNMADMRRKGRHPGSSLRGESHHNAKLSDEDVLAIRSAYTGQFGEQTALARQYGVSRSLVQRIVHGRCR